MAQPSNYPVELLHAIYSAATRPSCDDFDFSEKALIRQAIVACSHVSRHWRDAALSARRPWVHAVDFQAMPPDVISHFLALSSPHPIHVGHRSAPFQIKGRRDHTVLKMLGSFVQRLEELNLDIPDGCQLPSDCFWILGELASSVKIIRWTGLLSSTPKRRVWPEVPFPLSPLRVLCLRYTDFPLSLSMNLANLTALSLKDIPMQHGLELRQCVKLFKNTPNLELISLRDALVVHGSLPMATPEQDAMATLPHLKLFSWEGQYFYIMFILRRFLICPKTCTFNIGIDDLAATDFSLGSAHTQALWSFLSGMSKSLEPAPEAKEAPLVEMVFRKPTSHGMYALALGTLSNTDSFLDWAEGRSRDRILDILEAARQTDEAQGLGGYSKFVIGLEALGLNGFAYFAHVNDAIFVNLRKLRFAIDSPGTLSMLAPSSFIPVFGQMMKLEVLFLTLEAVDRFVSVAKDTLIAEEHAHADARGRAPILPRLKTIHVDCPPDCVDPKRLLGVMLVGQYLVWRQDIGYPVKAFC